MKAATVAPKPGMAPMMVPSMEDRKRTGTQLLNSGQETRLSSGLDENQTASPDRSSVLSFIWRNTSETAKKPINIGIRPMPSSNSGLPNVNRSLAVIGSRPIMPITTPSNIAMMPFQAGRLDNMPSEPRARMINTVYSAGPKLSATMASRLAKKIRQISLNVSPKTDA